MINEKIKNVFKKINKTTETFLYIRVKFPDGNLNECLVCLPKNSTDLGNGIYKAKEVLQIETMNNKIGKISFWKKELEIYNLNFGFEIQEGGRVLSVSKITKRAYDGFKKKVLK